MPASHCSLYIPSILSIFLKIFEKYILPSARSWITYSYVGNAFRLGMPQSDPIDKHRIDGECAVGIMEVNLPDGSSGRNIFRA